MHWAVSVFICLFSNKSIMSANTEMFSSTYISYVSVSISDNFRVLAYLILSGEIGKDICIYASMRLGLPFHDLVGNFFLFFQL